MTAFPLVAAGSPGWLEAALAIRPERRDTKIGSVRMHARWWGDALRGRPIVLLHGTAASSSWWDHVAPYLVDRGPVVAVDLTGHGDSGRRSSYDVRTWAADVVALCTALDLK